MKVSSRPAALLLTSTCSACRRPRSSSRPTCVSVRRSPEQQRRVA
jgi:hypothetical protein